MSMENWWNDTDGKKWKENSSPTNFFQRHWVHYASDVDLPGTEHAL
jgi:hypothetical protein